MASRASLGLVILGLATSGCAPWDPTAGYEVSGLPTPEADAARSALRRADTVLTIVGDSNGEYLGDASVLVSIGPDAGVVGITVSARRPRWSDGWISTEVAPPDEQAFALASSGWDFTVAFSGPNRPVLQGDHTRARLDSLQLRADPDALFFATLHATELDGSLLVVTITGRLSGGTGICPLWSGGQAVLPADIARCRAVDAHLSPATPRAANAPPSR